MDQQPSTITNSRRKLRLRWWLAIVSGFTVSHLLFSLIGHGFTGPHGEDLTFAQNIAHTVGLTVAGLIVFPLQRVALKPYLYINRWRIIVATIVFVGAFQLGAKTVRPPADWVLGFTALGTAGWIGLPGLKGIKILWTLLTIVGFWIGIVLAVPVMLKAIRAGVFDPDSPTLWDHTITWVLGAGLIGIIGGALSTWPLGRLLLPSEPVSAVSSIQ